MNGCTALFGACVALPLMAQAGIAGSAQPDKGHYVYVLPGATMVIVPSAEAVAMPSIPSDLSISRVFAQQDVMMRLMIADMDSLTPIPDPQQMILSVMTGMPQGAPGSGIVMTSISSGNGTCSQTITYGYPANGGHPQMKMSQTGNACGAITSSGPIGANQPLPVPQPVMPQQVEPRHDRVWTVGYPPHSVRTGTPPQS
jgi:hypothetical protein